jgi:hypothetical protein
MCRFSYSQLYCGLLTAFSQGFADFPNDNENLGAILHARARELKMPLIFLTSWPHSEKNGRTHHSDEEHFLLRRGHITSPHASSQEIPDYFHQERYSFGSESI